MRRYWAGIAGIIVAVLGLMATLAAEYIYAPPPPPLLSIQINSVHLFPFRKDPPPEPLLSHRHFQITGIALGAASLVLGIVSFLRHEPRRWAFATGALGIAAIAWTTVVIVLAALVFFLIFSGALFMGAFERKPAPPAKQQ